MINFIKSIKSKTIFFGTIIYCVLIGIIYSLNKFDMLYFMVNLCVFILTLALNVTKDILFLTTVDMFIRQRIPFKKRLLEIIKSICFSKLILLPLSICLLLLNIFVKIDLILLSKIITFSLIYVSQFLLLPAYKAITKSDWLMTIKVVSAELIITTLITQLFYYI